jgi:fructose-1,6-bisphosphatase/inositol monophosphatase family enzyme
VTLRTDLIERVEDLIKDVSKSALEPRFAAINEAEVREKSPGELVTDADEEGERLLTAGLDALHPGVPIVGEEACAADPSLVDKLHEEWAWLVDPVDGTRNFIAGSSEWAVMVALLHKAEAVMSWIWQPMNRRMYVAERGSGATVGGERLTSAPRASEVGALRGAASAVPRCRDAGTRRRLCGPLRRCHHRPLLRWNRVSRHHRGRAGLRSVLAHASVGSRSGASASRRGGRQGAAPRRHHLSVSRRSRRPPGGCQPGCVGQRGPHVCLKQRRYR